MMPGFRYHLMLAAFGVVLVLHTGATIAQIRQADLSLRIDVLSNPPYQAGDIWSLRVTVINQGPDATPDPVRIGTGLVSLNTFSVEEAECPVRFAGGIFGTATIRIEFPTLPAGVNHTCHIDFNIGQLISHHIRFVAYVFNDNWEDPNPDDNDVALFFDPDGRPLPIPALNGVALILLTSFFFSLGAIAIRSRNRAQAKSSGRSKSGKS